MRTLSTLLTRGLAVAVAALLAALVLLATFEIAAWTLFELSPAWTSELVGVLQVWFGLLAAVWVLGQGLHLRLELVADRLPRRLRGVVARLASTLVALFGALLAVYGFELARTVSNTLPATGWSASVNYVPAAVAGALLTFFALEEAIFGTEDERR